MNSLLSPQMRDCVAAAVRAHRRSVEIDPTRLSRRLSEAMPVAEWNAPLAAIEDEIVRVALAEHKALRLGA
jgi:hypothetical protein